jgi:hypothetical protein
MTDIARRWSAVATVAVKGQGCAGQRMQRVPLRRRLFVVTGQLQISDGRVVAVRDGLTMGRVAGCDIVIDDTKASRRHARIVVQDGVVEVEDLGSSNGTLLNGKPVQRRVVRDGDEIQIGATRIVYRAVAAAPAAAKDDDVDLFGGDEPSASAPQQAKQESDSDDLDFGADEPVVAKPAANPAPAAPRSAPPQPPRATVEFADEVVEVRKAAPAAAATRGAASGSGEPVLSQKQRVLQFSQNKSAAPLGDDLSQMSGGKRNAILVGVLLGALALAWFLMNAVS